MYAFIVLAILQLDAALPTLPGQATHISAHRGDISEAPENTLAAFASAVNKGAHQIELDVHLSSDGRLVLMHDQTVDRTTDGSGAVPDLDFETIRALDAGSWFDPAFEGAQVPTLREALEVIPKSILVNVHLRNLPGVAAQCAAVIQEMDRLDQAFLACTLQQAEEARAIAPEILICNMERQTGDRTAYIDLTIENECAFIQLHQNQGMENLAADVARLHDAGVHVNWFGTEDPEVMRALAEAGVDYILTDDLDVGLEVVEALGTAHTK